MPCRFYPASFSGRAFSLAPGLGLGVWSWCCPRSAIWQQVALAQCIPNPGPGASAEAMNDKLSTYAIHQFQAGLCVGMVCQTFHHPIVAAPSPAEGFGDLAGVHDALTSDCDTS